MNLSPLLPILISLSCGGAMLLLKNLEAFTRISARRVRLLTAASAGLWIVLTAAAAGTAAAPVLSTGGLTATLGGWSEPLGIVLVLDPVALAGVLLILCVGGASLLYAAGEKNFGPDFFFFVYFLLAACQGVLVSRDLFTIFVFFEVLAIAAYILIAYKRKPEAVLAGFRYLLIASVSIAFYLVGVFIIYRGTGTLSIPAAAALAGSLSRSESVLAMAALSVGILTRMAAVPFHGWLPAAHSIATHPVSALLSGMVIKAPLVVLFRVSALFPADQTRLLGNVLLPFGLLSSAAGVFLALQQRDAKRLLAWHSISQMGYIICAFSVYLSGTGAAAAAGGAGALFHAFNHGLFKSLLFLSVGASCDRAGSRDVYRVRGLGRKAGPWTLLFLAGAMSISGVPLFNGYASKFLISEALHYHRTGYLVLLLVAAGTAASFIKLGRMYFPGGAKEAGQASNAPGTAGAALLAAGCLALGTLPPLLFPPLAGAFSPGTLAKQAAVLAAGLLLYFAAVGRPGKILARAVRSAAAGTDLLLGMMLGGFILLWGILFFGG